MQFNALATWADKYAFIEKGLTKESMAVFAILPQAIQQQLFLERDPHGNVQVSLIESEKLFSALVSDKTGSKKSSRHLQRKVQRPALISSDTKEDAHSRPTSMLTTATLWATTHSC
ncbi:MAG: hypothetical protein ACLTSZ_10925 [Lachnospiraceae bacterium]